ncbi:MAG: hypothetical protein ACXV4A_09225 [Actinomycetes bacterium]
MSATSRITITTTHAMIQMFVFTLSPVLPVVRDINLVDADELDLAAELLRAAEPSLIYLDLGRVTFRRSTLIHSWRAAALAAGHARRPLVVCRNTMTGKAMQGGRPPAGMI